MTQPLVKKLLESHFEQAVAAAMGWPIAWPNAEFTPPDNGSFFEFHIMPAQRQILDVQGKMQQFTGAVQISVVVPPGDGTQNTVGIAQQVAEMFSPDTVISGSGLVVSITSFPTVFDGNDFGGGYMVPVSFEYEAH